MSAALALNSISCELDDRVLFSGLSACFEPGDLVQVVGPNGAGKTTLLKILTGLSHHYSGELRWGEYLIPSYEFYCALLFIGHNPGVKSSLTPRENLAWYFGLNGDKRGDRCNISTSVDDSRLLEALNHVGLSGYADIPCFQMSAGQQRRVALARLYISEAPLWILDEPFTAIDKHGVAKLEQRMEVQRERGGIVVLTTHQAMSHAQPKLLDLADFAGDAS